MRKCTEELGINKDTVRKAFDELISGIWFSFTRYLLIDYCVLKDGTLNVKSIIKKDTSVYRCNVYDNKIPTHFDQSNKENICGNGDEAETAVLDESPVFRSKRMRGQPIVLQDSFATELPYEDHESPVLINICYI